MTTRRSFRGVSTAARFARCRLAVSSGCRFRRDHPAPFDHSLR
jgi:hypothetical protein